MKALAVHIKPERLFFIIALIAGMTLSFLLPAGSGTDEETHFARIYEMALGRPIPNSLFPKIGLPQGFNEVSYRQQKTLQPITAEYFAKNLSYTVRNSEANSYRTRATYSPLNYLLQAFLFRIFGWDFNSPLLVLYYLLRLTYVITYAILGYWAIRLLPIGKWILLVLALAPTAVLQSATISADPITNGISFLFLAWCLHLLIDRPAMDKKATAITLALVFLLANIKLNALPLLLLLVFI